MGSRPGPTTATAHTVSIGRAPRCSLPHSARLVRCLFFSLSAVLRFVASCSVQDISRAALRVRRCRRDVMNDSHDGTDVHGLAEEDRISAEAARNEAASHRGRRARDRRCAERVDRSHESGGGPSEGIRFQRADRSIRFATRAKNTGNTHSSHGRAPSPSPSTPGANEVKVGLELRRRHSPLQRLIS
jgi:hypothetical protein